MVDYIFANGTALGMIDKITIDDYPPHINLRNCHSHQLIQTHFGKSSQGCSLLVGKIHYCWVPGIGSTWVEYTSTSDFVDGLAAMVGGEYSTTDQLNTVVKQYML